jgi:hypothetical protein
MPQVAIACRRIAVAGRTPGFARLPRRSGFAQAGKFYRPRDHEASPFFKIVRNRFDEFERVYPERYQ